MMMIDIGDQYDVFDGDNHDSDYCGGCDDN